MASLCLHLHAIGQTIESGSRLIQCRVSVCESETAKVKLDWCESVGERRERKGIYVCVCLYRRPRLH